jgi:hypothetical protein
MSTQRAQAVDLELAGAEWVSPYTSCEATRDGIGWLPTVVRYGIGVLVLDTVDRRRTVESAELAALGLDLRVLAAGLTRAVLG